MINETLEKSKNFTSEMDLKKQNSEEKGNPELFDAYLKSVNSNFKKEITRNISNGNFRDDMVSSLLVDAICGYRLFKEENSLVLEIVMTSHLEYGFNENLNNGLTSSNVNENDDENYYQSTYLEDLEDSKTGNKKIKISVQKFLDALASNGFNYVIDADKENINMVENAKLEDIRGVLIISKNYIRMPKRTAEEKARMKLTLSKIYSDKKKFF